MKLKVKIRSISMRVLVEHEGKSVDISFLLPRGFKLSLIERSLAKYLNLPASDNIETFVRNLFKSLYGENLPESIRKSEKDIISYLKWALEQGSSQETQEAQEAQETQVQEIQETQQEVQKTQEVQETQKSSNINIDKLSLKDVLPYAYGSEEGQGGES